MPTAEHYMMAEKARLFGDVDTCDEILATQDPALAKKLGRQVRGYNDERWVKERVQVAVRGNTAKVRPERRSQGMAARDQRRRAR